VEAVLVPLDLPAKGLVSHMPRAICFGAMREELVKALETCLVPGGAVTFHRGLSALKELDRDGRQ